MNRRSGWKMNEDERTSNVIKIENAAPIEPAEGGGGVEFYQNKVYFYTYIESDTSLTLKKTLQERKTDMRFFKDEFNLPEIPAIELHIQSYGGGAHTGLELYDYIKNSKIPINTYVDGVAASAATLMSIAGNKRYMTKNSVMLIHQLRQTFWGTLTYDQLVDEKTNAENLMKIIKNAYLESTKLTEEMLNELLEKDLYLNSEDCLKFGLVDYVI